MRMLFKAVAFIVVLLVLPFATDSQAESTSEQIKALKQQIEQMQKQNQQQIEELQQKIQDLEVKKEAEKEKIIEEIKAEQKDAWYNKIEVSYKKPGDGFTIRTKDGNFSLNMRLRGQFQLSVNDTTDEDTATSFRVRRLRFYWIGNAFRPWFEYYIQVSADNSFSGSNTNADTNSDLQLRDAYFNAAYEKKAVPRVGQFKVPFNREELNSSSELQLVERSILNEEFTLARDIGTALYGLFGNYVTYGIGIFNGDGRNEASLDSNLLYVGRIMLTPCCGELKYANSSFPIGGDYKIEPNFGEDKPLIAFGAAVAGMEGLNTAIKTPDAAIVPRLEQIGFPDGEGIVDLVQFTADVNFKYKIFSIEGEYDARWISPDADQGVSTDTVFDQGFRVQSGVFLIPKLVEVAARFAYIDYDTNVPNIEGVDDPDNSWQITPGLNFYMSRSHKWKIQLDYSFIKNEFTNASDIDENIFRAQLQAYF